jgi:hypothetical protein
MTPFRSARRGKMRRDNHGLTRHSRDSACRSVTYGHVIADSQPYGR